jgi:hypothetical protein
MARVFPLEVEALDVPFAVVPNAAFPDATPVCVLTNLGASPAFDTFIKSYFPFPPHPAAGSMEGPDPWQIEFRWQTKGPAVSGTWHLDAWLESLTDGPNMQVPGFPHAVTGGPAYDEIFAIAPDAVLPAPPPIASDTAKLFRLVTTFRWAEAAGKRTRVVGRGIGPIIEFYEPVP